MLTAPDQVLVRRQAEKGLSSLGDLGLMKESTRPGPRPSFQRKSPGRGNDRGLRIRTPQPDEGSRKDLLRGSQRKVCVNH